MHEIIEGLYLGGLVDATNRDLLQRAKVVGIVNCCTPIELPLSSRVEGLEYFSVDVEDIGAEPIEDYFHDAADFIHRYVMKKEVVLVHCKSGVSRSSTVTIAYLVIKKHFHLHNAFFHVRAKRDVICPNIGFMNQLCKLESSFTESHFQPEFDERTEKTSMRGPSDMHISSTVLSPLPSSSAFDDWEVSNMANSSSIANSSSSNCSSNSTSANNSGSTEQSDKGESGEVLQFATDPLQPLKNSSMSNTTPRFGTSRNVVHSSRSPRNSNSYYLNDLLPFPSKYLDYSTGEWVPSTSSKSIAPLRSRTREEEHPLLNLNLPLISHLQSVRGPLTTLTNDFPSVGRSTAPLASTENVTASTSCPLSSTESKFHRSRCYGEPKVAYQPKRLKKQRNYYCKIRQNSNNVNSLNVFHEQEFHYCNGTLGETDPHTSSVCSSSNDLEKSRFSSSITIRNINSTKTSDIHFDRGKDFSLSRCPSICMDKYIDWYIADASYRAAVPDLDP